MQKIRDARQTLRAIRHLITISAGIFFVSIRDSARTFKMSKRLLFAGIGIFVLSFAGTTTLLRTQTSVNVQLSATRNVSITAPLTITLGQSVKSIPLEDVQLLPDVEGEWSRAAGNLLQGDALTFTPNSNFTTGTTYSIRIPALPRYIAGTTEPTEVTFSTEAAPGIADAGLASLAENATVPADYSPSITLTAQNNNLRDLTITTQPKIEMTMQSNGTSYTWRPKGLLPQGKTVTVEVYDNKAKSTVLKKALKVATAPSLRLPLSQGGFTKNTPLTIAFSQKIVRSTASINVSTGGSGTWKDDSTYIFTPTELKPGVTYSYTIGKNTRTHAGGILTKDIKGTFSARGPIRVSGSSPWGSELLQAAQTISFTFDHPVDHKSAEKRFSVSAGSIQSMSWSGNTLRVEVRNLGFQRTATASIAPGVINTEFGLPSTQTFSVSFTTEIRSKRLNVPHFMQQHASSCAVASLRMVLAYRGINDSEESIVTKMGYKPTKLNTSANTWDDPQKMFVGNLDGSLAAGTAAGPDAPPVAKAAQAYGRGASAVNGIGSTWIAQQLYNGNPVVMFGAYGAQSGYKTWKTPSGSTAKMNNASHSTVVIGVKGDASRPLGFWVNDPLAGATRYWTVGQVNANISLDAYRQAVVVY